MSHPPSSWPRRLIQMLLVRIEQPCPQCGAGLVIGEGHRFLLCAHCGAGSFLQGSDWFRFALPALKASGAPLLYAPYLRFKGSIFHVSEDGLRYRMLDTTQAAHPLACLPPSLGLRPQAMRVHWLAMAESDRCLPNTLHSSQILHKAVSLAEMDTQPGAPLWHRAYIGETMSLIYLPLERRREGLVDAVNGLRLASNEQVDWRLLKSTPYQEAWRPRFEAALCPQCGAGLKGEAEARALICCFCRSAWALGDAGLSRLDWAVVAPGAATDLLLPFWQIETQIPLLTIHSFADFIARTNQAYIPRLAWRQRPMSYWSPAFHLPAKIMLQAARQATLMQWRLQSAAAESEPPLFPVTLPASEARQMIKLIIAAAASHARRIYSLLPRVRTQQERLRLVYLPFQRQGGDWVQAHTAVSIAAPHLHFSHNGIPHIAPS